MMIAGGKDSLSIVIPVDLKRRTRDLSARVLSLVCCPGMDEMEIVIALNDRGRLHDRQLLRRLSGLRHVKVVAGAFYDGDVNNGLLRNRAAEAAAGSNLLLLDADIYPDPALFKVTAERMRLRGESMVILPCLYMTEWATRRLLARRDNSESVLAGFFGFDRRYYTHLANPSSVMACRREDYWAIDGFDESYSGHGYEDFDFMIRLALHLQMLSPNAGLLIDKPYRAPLLASGFRMQLGNISLPRLLDKQIALHCSHTKNIAERYYQARRENASKFYRKLSKLVVRELDCPDENASLAERFFSLCQEKDVSPRDFLALLDGRPGHIDNFSRWTRRLRFVLTHR